VTTATLLGLVVVAAVSVGACGRAPVRPVRDVTERLPAIPVHSVGDLVGRWESTVPGLRWVWVVKEDGAVAWSDGRGHGTARLTTEAGRVLFTPASGRAQVFTLYLLPDNRLLLGNGQGVRLMLTPHRP
jgi:hypothetical protein